MVADNAGQDPAIFGASPQSAINRQLVGWAAILAVPTAAAGFYGMNFDNMPEFHWRYGYIAVLLGVVIAYAILFARFRKAGWI
jgi:magnesium transporter